MGRKIQAEEEAEDLDLDHQGIGIDDGWMMILDEENDLHPVDAERDREGLGLLCHMLWLCEQWKRGRVLDFSFRLIQRRFPIKVSAI